LAISVARKIVSRGGQHAKAAFQPRVKIVFPNYPNCQKIFPKNESMVTKIDTNNFNFLRNDNLILRVRGAISWHKSPDFYPSELKRCVN
jgi:hypothetical protein